MESETPTGLPALLRTLRVWDVDLPDFDPESAPTDPVPLFESWFADAVAAGQVEPHVMSLATAGADGLPDVRYVMLHGADRRGWQFATHAVSRKGRQLAERPYAALGFYWPALGRQVRVRGPVVPASEAESQGDLHARSTGALAAALVGRQSDVLGDADELARVSDLAWERAGREPRTPVPSWTVYTLAPDEVEFFQGDERRRHVRLRYRRDSRQGAQGTWVKELLWP
ncbi:pyridoxal 5'-phosphate synthase [Streptomyces sp. NPDC058001]|uniref:pyridoxine/pyridoxamine 5'-phosphate oxidase n=1 Tax=Streptomyces sp. NPDC058001 TaxID=3346300 RepID=UPI0036E008A3